jgi:hypothetical protein
MSKSRVFRRESDGELMVYPPFVSGADGYDIIVWNDMTEAEAERYERHAKRAADDSWAAKHGNEPRTESRIELPAWTTAHPYYRRMIRVIYRPA